MISLSITDSEKQRRETDERARVAHRQAIERTSRSKVVFPKTKNQQQQLPPARAFDNSSPEYIRAKAESTAIRMKWKEANKAYAEAISEASETLDASELSPELQAFAKTIQDHGPALTLAMFAKLFPQLDIEVSSNLMLMPQRFRVIGI